MTYSYELIVASEHRDRLAQAAAHHHRVEAAETADVDPGPERAGRRARLGYALVRLGLRLVDPGRLTWPA
jgi:hypothetical protein